MDVKQLVTMDGTGGR